MSSAPNTATQARMSPLSMSRGLAHGRLLPSVEMPSPPPFQLGDLRQQIFDSPVPPPHHDTSLAQRPLRPMMPASSSSLNDRIPAVSSPFQCVGGTVNPIGRPSIETPKYWSYEYNVTKRTPYSYHSVPDERSTATQPLSQSVLPAAFSLAMPRATTAASVSGPSSNAKCENIQRKQSRSTRRTNKNKVQAANDDGHQKFTPTARTILSDDIRYAPRCYLITYDCYNIFQVQNPRRWQGAC